MGSIGNPKTWVPYMNTKDCSQGFCSLYCPQWCYIIFSPPPPVEFPDDDSSPNFSPLVIAVIGILASAFLLVSYYTIISKYCGNADSTRRRSSENHDAGEVSGNTRSHEPWQTSTGGLDEALINSITVFKFKKGDRLIEGTDCSVCLSEFQEEESLRLLPKCSHAFHVHCIDTWLRSHSNCPLCRANIILVTASSPLPLPPPPQPPVAETPQEGNGVFSQESQESRSRSLQRDVGGPVAAAAAPKTPSRAFSDLGNVRGRNTVIEIREEGCYYQKMRRSVSLDRVHVCQTQLSVADILQMKQEEEEEEDSRVEENIQKTNTFVVNV